MQGKKILLVDADPQGDLTTCLGWHEEHDLQNTISDMMTKVMQGKEYNLTDGIVHHHEGVDIAFKQLSIRYENRSCFTMNREGILKSHLETLKDKYDYILIDCYPSLGMMTFNVLSAADSIIIPVQTQYLPAKCMTQLLQTGCKGKTKHKPEPKNRRRITYPCR